jgi:hypothetical protein
LRRLQLINDDKIFGVPLNILDKPNLISRFVIERNHLYYHPMNPEETTDINNPLAGTLLKFNLDPLTEY